jgi:hypothetical protein
MAKRKNLEPKEDYATQSLTQLNIQRTRMGDREFRDALTRASGAVVGVKTHVYDGKRFGV